MTDIPPEPGSIVELLERDHLVVRGMLGSFDTTATHEWGEVFRQLVEYLVRHEIAEEEVVFPTLREALPDAAATVDECEAEQHDSERLLIEMERTSVTDPSFREMVGRLRDALDAHLAREDLVLVPMLRSLGSYEDAGIASRYEVARTAAPARPEGVVVPDRRLTRAGFVGRLRAAGRRR